MLIHWACLVWTKCSWNLSTIICIWLFMESIQWRIYLFSPASWPQEHMLDLRKGSNQHKSSVLLKKEEKFRISFGFQTWKDLVRENCGLLLWISSLFPQSLCILPLFQSKFKTGRNEQSKINFKFSNIHSYFMIDNSACSLTPVCNMCLCLPSLECVCKCTCFVMRGRERKTQEATVPKLEEHLLWNGLSWY